MLRCVALGWGGVNTRLSAACLSGLPDPGGCFISTGAKTRKYRLVNVLEHIFFSYGVRVCDVMWCDVV